MALSALSTNCFDLGAFKAHFGDQSREKLVHLARTAEAAERYEDMCSFMKELVTNTTQDLTVEERNLLSVAYKNVIGTRRASWRTLNQEGGSDAEEKQLCGVYRKQVESELATVCMEVLELLESHLVPNAPEDGEPRVFYLKMIGDYYRYLAESIATKDHDIAAAKYYGQAFEVAEKTLQPTHPIRLGLALNYSVCYYEILKDKKKACDLAKNAFDQAISKLDKLEENDYKDSTLIMQLLRDNLTLWTSNEDGDDDVTVEDLDDDN